MKANVEAWQAGDEDGWNDGYYGNPRKTTFIHPFGWKYLEQVNYENGYKQGQQDRQTNA